MTPFSYYPQPLITASTLRKIQLQRIIFTLISGLLLLIAISGRLHAEPFITVDGIPAKDLQAAFNQAHDDSTILLSAGDFKQAGLLKANRVTISGVSGKTRIHSATTKGKGALVIKGNDTRIQNIECFNIQVHSKNGACIRLSGKNLHIDNVYFHDSEQGLLAGSHPGDIIINNSRFERLGKNGRAHGIYVGGGTLVIMNSYFLASKSEGHEIKSRAQRTTIINSVIASLDGNDSRLIDAPNGGVLELKNNILQQGPMSSNRDMIGYGLEGYKYPDNQIHIMDNLFIMERKGNVPLNRKQTDIAIQMDNNTFVGNQLASPIDDNQYFPDRQAAQLPLSPALPDKWPAQGH
ncbi:hypothetical protein [Neptunicella sp. SCSIO 80796]|uniref:hypothetical protein n=1 Tax=Neptunicella plasticusilytica TaxID=3117012 RepID=UPI003A4DE25F